MVKAFSTVFTVYTKSFVFCSVILIFCYPGNFSVMSVQSSSYQFLNLNSLEQGSCAIGNKSKLINHKSLLAGALCRT